VSEPTREEKIRTIKAARQVMQNLMEQHAPLIREYAEMMNQQQKLFKNAPWMPKQPPPAAPQEDPADQAAMKALLEEVKNSQGEKR
jgi:hypothetical protein